MRRPQFTLRALLTAMLVIAAFFGGMAWQRALTGKQATQRELDLEARYDALFLEVRRMLDEHLQEKIDEQMNLRRESQASPVGGAPHPNWSNVPHPQADESDF